MLPGRAGALCGAGRAPGMRRRSGPRAIGLGADGFATGRAALRAGFFALAPARLIGAGLLGRLPLPAPLAAFFFAMARSCCLPCCRALSHKARHLLQPDIAGRIEEESRHKGGYMLIKFSPSHALRVAIAAGAIACLAACT